MRSRDSKLGRPSEGFSIVQTYEELAGQGASDLCCSPVNLYSPEELAALPEETLALSSGCGHPVRFSQISSGATVLDVGSGAGGDCLLAARLVGSEGRVIGVDPSPTMRRRAARAAEELGLLDRVSFVHGTGEELPVPDSSVDVVISNCVLSLASHPEKVWREVARVLRPGGRFTVSDVVGGSEETLRTKTRCETGISWDEYSGLLRGAGFSGIQLLDAGSAHFRDGTAAVSATIRGRWGLDPRSVFVQMFHYSVPQRALNSGAASLVKVAEEHGAVCDLETRDLREESSKNVLRLMAGDAYSTEDITGLARERYVHLSADGRYLGRWDAAGGDKGELQDMLKSKLL